MKYNRLPLMLGAVLCAGLGIWQLGGGTIIAIKAAVAPILIGSAWDESLRTGKPLKPWSWADTHPVAKLSVPAKNITHYVLAGDNMRALAFGPVIAEVGGTPILFGHRDTHFNFLKNIEMGDIFTVQNLYGEIIYYRAEAAWTAHKDALAIPEAESNSQILLVSCYPFDTITATDERIIIQAIRI